jgi:hypothetical protein
LKFQKSTKFNSQSQLLQYFKSFVTAASICVKMLAMLGLVGSCLSLAQMFLLELRELEHISWTFWEVPLLVLFTSTVFN